MIFSRDHNYVFVQLSRTGCTAVARELVEYYGGSRILAKHSRFHEFEQSDFFVPDVFVFSAVRHPLDDLVSAYEKLRTNHENYLDPARHHSQPRGYITDKTIEQYRFVSSGGGFEEYVRRYHRLPFDNFASLAHNTFDRVMRFERLSEDFEEVLIELGIEPVRSLPSRNATERTKKSWESYFESASLQRFVTPRVHPFMRRWGYEFPSGWDRGSPMALPLGEAAFRILQIRRKRTWLIPAPGFEDGK